MPKWWPWVHRRAHDQAIHRAMVAEQHARRLDQRFAEMSALNTQLTHQLETAHQRYEKLTLSLLDQRVSR